MRSIDSFLLAQLSEKGCNTEGNPQVRFGALQLSSCR